MRVIAIIIVVGSFAWRAAAQVGPTATEEIAIIEKARELALEYTANLPNFICTETIRRSVLPSRSQTSKLLDTLAVDVAFSNKGERYNMLSINGKPTKKKFSEVGGAISDGDFGTVLQWVFQPASQTTFHWESTSDLRGRPMHVFSYRVEQKHSKFQMHASKRYRMIAGFGGLVYVDRETNRVMRITYAPSDVPADWPITAASTQLDYGFIEISGQKALLPLHAELNVTMRDGSQARNEMEFSSYRKFSSELILKFEPQ